MLGVRRPRLCLAEPLGTLEPEGHDVLQSYGGDVPRHAHQHRAHPAGYPHDQPAAHGRPHHLLPLLRCRCRHCRRHRRPRALLGTCGRTFLCGAARELATIVHYCSTSSQVLLSVTAGITVDYATHVGHSFLVQVFFFVQVQSAETQKNCLPFSSQVFRTAPVEQPGSQPPSQGTPC